MVQDCFAQPCRVSSPGASRASQPPLQVTAVHGATFACQATAVTTVQREDLHLWPGLLRFLDDPKLALDNNGTERALRGVVVGRKNHYGSRSQRGTEVAALFYSLIESAKLAGVEPDAYLRAAARSAIRGDRIPLPHEQAAS